MIVLDCDISCLFALYARYQQYKPEPHWMSLLWLIWGNQLIAFCLALLLCHTFSQNPIHSLYSYSKHWHNIQWEELFVTLTPCLESLTLCLCPLQSQTHLNMHKRHLFARIICRRMGPGGKAERGEVADTLWMPSAHHSLCVCSPAKPPTWLIWHVWTWQISFQYPFGKKKEVARCTFHRGIKIIYSRSTKKLSSPFTENKIEFSVCSATGHFDCKIPRTQTPARMVTSSRLCQLTQQIETQINVWHFGKKFQL